LKRFPAAVRTIAAPKSWRGIYWRLSTTAIVERY
jgi:hypothetical protein